MATNCNAGPILILATPISANCFALNPSGDNFIDTFRRPSNAFTS